MVKGIPILIFGKKNPFALAAKQVRKANNLLAFPPVSKACTTKF